MPFTPKKSKFVSKLKETNSDIDSLIYGVDKTTRIVSIENKDDMLHIFRQLENGKIEVTKKPSKFWLLTNEQVSDSQTLFKGEQHYKYIATFDNQKARDAAGQACKRELVDFYRIYNQKEQSLVYHGMTYFKGMKPKEVSILSWDLETETLQNEAPTARILIITGTFRDHAGKITRKRFSLDDYKGDERKMIGDWMAWVCKMDPSLMVGHNIYGFDLPYVRARCQALKIKFAIGRDGSSAVFDKFDRTFRKDGSQGIDYKNCEIFGRELVDTMFLSYQYDIARMFFSYGLKPIIKQLGFEKPNRTFVDASKIGKYYREHLAGDSTNWNLAKQYAEEDSDDALTLFDVMIPAKFYFTQTVSKPFQVMVNSATGSQLNNIMVRSYMQIGHSIAKASQAEAFVGAISFGIPGVYKNGLKCDVSSLYPSIMRQFKVYCTAKDPFEHFIKITEYFATERLKNKKLAKETGDQYYEDLQQSQKVAANSLYGFLGASGLNYNYPFGAAFITAKGREILEKAMIFATGKDLEYWRHVYLKSVGKEDKPDELDIIEYEAVETAEREIEVL